MSALCALEDVKSYLGITNTNQDALITTLISNASAFIESFCGRVFESASYSETRNGNGAASIFTRQSPITAVSSVTVDGVAIQAAPDTISYGYVTDGQRIYLRGSAGVGTRTQALLGGFPIAFTRGIQNVVLAYTAGYAVIPADLNQACVELIADKLAKQSRIDKKSETLGSQQTVSFDLSDMPARVRTALGAYRLPMIAP